MKKAILLFIFLGLIALAALVFWPKSNNAVLISDTPEKVSETNNVKVITGLKTCSVCGYNALEKKGEACHNCGNAINAETLSEEGLGSIDELIMIRQIDFFMPDTLGAEIDFLSPVVSQKRYPKNSNWHPRIYESQIYEIQKAISIAEKMKDSLSTNAE